PVQNFSQSFSISYLILPVSMSLISISFHYLFRTEVFNEYLPCLYCIEQQLCELRLQLLHGCQLYLLGTLIERFQQLIFGVCLFIDVNSGIPLKSVTSLFRHLSCCRERIVAAYLLDAVGYAAPAERQ